MLPLLPIKKGLHMTSTPVQDTEDRVARHTMLNFGEKAIFDSLSSSNKDVVLAAFGISFIW